MNCPPEIAEIVLEILTMGILRIRILGWRGDSGRCAIEADHLHNLPDLLSHYSPEALRFYWEAERAAFIGQSSAADLASFEPLWNRLSACLPGRTEQAVRP